MRVASDADCLAAHSGLIRIEADAHTSPDVVVYQSRGCVLVLGDDARIGPVAQRVAAHHTVVAFAPGVDVSDWGSKVTAVGRKVTHLKGYLGAFQGEIHVGDEITDIGPASPNPSRCFDLVLDLSAQPLIAHEVKPLGYFAPGTDEQALTQAIDAMRTLVGRFAKPRYFNYAGQLCAHSASGFTGCTRCLSVCSAQAIRSTGSNIAVNPHLCQGCATCTLSCPTGALTFRAPDRPTLGERLQAVLADAGKGVNLVVHGPALDPAVPSAWAPYNKVVLFQVDPLPAFGDELWLRALALGAQTLVLLDDPALPAAARALLAERTAQVQTMMAAAGHHAERLAFLSADALPAWLAQRARQVRSEASAVPVAPLKAWDKFKRLAWMDGLRQLGNTGQTQVTALPMGAPFGAVRVDAKRCSLCFACVNLCPTRALNAGRESLHQLIFQESACVQCGLCVAACPEKAMSLQARVAPLDLVNLTSRVLHQDALLKCKSCGAPFISQKMLESSWNKLKDHPELSKGGYETLMICPSCRQREMLQM
ncbi:MAG: 4Fe-4S dicluster domain-containing protein [Rhodoferax sp.]